MVYYIFYLYVLGSCEVRYGLSAGFAGSRAGQSLDRCGNFERRDRPNELPNPGYELGIDHLLTFLRVFSEKK